MIPAAAAPAPSAAPPRSLAGDPRWILVEAAAVAGVSLIAFYRSLGLFFLPGDCNWLALAIWGNEELPSLASQGAFRPLARVIFKLAFGAFGMEPLPYRLALLALHGVVSVLAGRIVARMLRRPSVGWMAAAIFAVAPAASEAVRSIASFVYPCVALLVLGGLVLYARAIERASVVAWCAAVACFGTAAFLREHWVVALPLAMVLELSVGGPGVTRTRGPWIRLGPLLIGGILYTLARKLLSGVEVFPNAPEYVFDESMASRFLVTIQRLVLPEMPLPILEHPVAHQLIGAALLVGVLVIASRAPREERRAGFLLFAAMVVSMLPFLPVTGDHLRQRFTYLATAFAAGLVVFVIHVVSGRVSPRLTLPLFLAVMVGLLLEQQASFEATYELPAAESRARFQAYPKAAEQVRDDNGLAVLFGDFEPSLQSARSTFRVVAPVARRQILQLDVANASELSMKLVQLYKASRATGVVRLYVRGARGYDFVPISSFEPVAGRVFEGTPSGTKRVSIFVLLPRPTES